MEEVIGSIPLGSTNLALIDITLRFSVSKPLDVGSSRGFSRFGAWLGGPSRPAGKIGTGRDEDRK
jgi:hypothetical protein